MNKQNTPGNTSKQIPGRGQFVVKTPISSAQQASRKLIQRSVKLLNTPKSTSNTSLPSQINLFPPTQHDAVNTKLGEDTLTDSNLSASRTSGTNRSVDLPTTAPNFRQPMINILKLPSASSYASRKSI